MARGRRIVFHRLQHQHVQRALAPNVRRTLDRGQWAEDTQLIIAFDFDGVGAEQVDVEFGIVFEGAPLYSWGVEMQEDETLSPGDFPHVTSGVAAWNTKEASTNSEGRLLYLGATVWYRSVASRGYRTRLRTSFEGIIFKNPQYFVGE